MFNMLCLNKHSPDPSFMGPKHDHPGILQKKNFKKFTNYMAELLIVISPLKPKITIRPALILTPSLNILEETLAILAIRTELFLLIVKYSSLSICIASLFYIIRIMILNIKLFSMSSECPLTTLKFYLRDFPCSSISSFTPALSVFPFPRL